MRDTAPSRVQPRSRGVLRPAAVLLCTLPGLLLGQTQSQPSPQPARSALPPTPSTISSSPQPTAPTDASHVAHHPAEVRYANGLLTVVASNSSLNQILREIARETGMKITGGVREDRVFGTYGPASPATILRTLLDGTGSNILLVEDRSDTPTELFLTPRSGGVTPPNPNARGFDDADEDASDTAAPRPPVQVSPLPPVNSRSPQRPGVGGIDVNPAATAPSTTTRQVVFPPVDGSNAPATATSTPTNPDGTPAEGVRTPQQIFEQLQRLRQQQQQQQQQQQSTPPQ